jgi:signal transduction histidine kinase
VLGLVWNLGCLVIASHDFGVPEISEYLDALSYSALAFLPAVVVHSIVREQPGKVGRWITWAAYGISAIAAVGHFTNVYQLGFAPWPRAAHGLGTVYGFFIIPLALVTGSQPTWKRAMWMFALAVFALFGSEIAYHTEGSVLLDLIGHHATMPLAFVILYQEYRFALADRFLKSAIAIITLVSLAMGAYVVIVARLGDSLSAPTVMVAVLGLWIVTALVYPVLTRGISWLVDRWLLGRDNYGHLRAEVSQLVQSAETSTEVLNAVGDRLAVALNGKLTWSVVLGEVVDLSQHLDESLAQALEHRDEQDVVWLAPRGSAAAILVATAESPRYVWTVTELSEGRRLGQEDAAFLEWVALRVARRIDRLRIVHERYEHELREQEMGKLTTEAELKALRAQINPHFLFNALTTIGHLIQTAPDRAVDTLLNLTELLRRVLRSTEEWVPLGAEIDLVVAYLDIERARFEERLEIDIDVPAELRVVKLPPLILQPLVENSIKHGIARLKQGGRVAVSARLADGALQLRVEDTGAGASEAAFGTARGEGVGLKNVKERLRGYYGDGASLSIESRPGVGTTVQLRVPTDSSGRSRRRAEAVASGS